MANIITFGVGNSKIQNQDDKTKILSYVACFFKMFSENRLLASCLLTLSTPRFKKAISIYSLVKIQI